MDILEYYKNYHKSGHYSLSWFKDSSRHLMIQNWIRENFKPGQTILDVGCGDGSFSEWMPEFNWVGVDINEEKSKYNGKRLTHNIEVFPYPFEDQSFDGVVCSEVLEHLWNPEGVHQEVYRLLKPKGVYIISTPNFNWIEHMLKGWAQVIYAPKQASHTKEHIRFYDVHTHIEMLKEAKFTPLDFCGADAQWGEFFQMARQELKKELPAKNDGDIDLLIGRMFRTACHTIGLMAVKGN
jgi:2-polyprenyl-3-methyl-5-hydroxy-6-metoxy-1,4-benzoquinol methylase